MGKKKKGAYRYGKAVSFDFRAKHPIVHKKPKNGSADSIPLTHSANEEGRRHLRLPKRISISHGERRKRDGRTTYAIDRVIVEDERRMSKPLPARITKADNAILNRIFKRHKAKKKG
jgi:hypothetical protein